MGGDWINKTRPRYKHIPLLIMVWTFTPSATLLLINELLTLKENRKAILMVAGIRDAKDQDTVVKALSSLGKDKFEVWFAGNWRTNGRSSTNCLSH